MAGIFKMLMGGGLGEVVGSGTQIADTVMKQVNADRDRALETQKANNDHDEKILELSDDRKKNDDDTALANRAQDADDKNDALQNAIDTKESDSQIKINEQDAADDKRNDDLEFDKKKREDDQDKKAGDATNDDDFNVRSNFLQNAGESIKDMTLGQFNIMISTDNEADKDKSDCANRLAPMSLIKIPTSIGEISFEVRVFDSWMFVRAGSMAKDSLWFWPFDAARDHFDAQGNLPAGTHFEFNEQKKLDTADLPKLEDAQKKAASKKNKENNVAANIGEEGEEDEGEATKGKKSGKKGEEADRNKAKSAKNGKAGPEDEGVEPEGSEAGDEENAEEGEADDEEDGEADGEEDGEEDDEEEGDDEDADPDAEDDEGNGEDEEEDDAAGGDEDEEEPDQDADAADPEEDEDE